MDIYRVRRLFSIGVRQAEDARIDLPPAILEAWKALCDLDPLTATETTGRDAEARILDIQDRLRQIKESAKRITYQVEALIQA